MSFTREQAFLIIDAHEIDVLLTDPEESELLEENNPEILEAYKALMAYANGK